MYIKFWQNYNVDTKRSDEANTKLSPDSKLSVELNEQTDKEDVGNVRVYRAVCIFLSITCLFLLLVILILGMKYVAGPVGCPERLTEEVVTRSPLVCSLQICQAQFPELQDQESGCQPCAKDWEAFEGSCFYFSVKRENWEGSRKSCIDKGGDLAVIPNQKVQDFLFRKANMQYWIGLRNETSEWTWVNNTILEESYWAQNAQAGDCGVLRGVSQEPGLTSRKNWIKASCWAGSYYICQRKKLWASTGAH